MTRINAGIKPSSLTNKHLLAEHREIKRIPNCIRKGKYNLDGIPEYFKLGTGHVKFFYNKLNFLFKRYLDLYEECKNRGFNVEYYGEAWDDTPKELWGDYMPTRECIELITNRINERLKQ